MRDKEPSRHVKARMNPRLKADGYWQAYNTARSRLKRSGVDETVAWVAAAYLYPPKDGSLPEISDHRKYSEVAAGWKNGKYDKLKINPNIVGVNDLKDNPEQQAAKKKIEDDILNGALQRMSDEEALWTKLALGAFHKEASELDETRWCLKCAVIPVTSIPPESVPSSSAVALLKWMKQSPHNYAAVISHTRTKMMPNQSQIEYQSKFRDDGRLLGLIGECKAGAVEETQVEQS